MKDDMIADVLILIVATLGALAIGVVVFALAALIGYVLGRTAGVVSAIVLVALVVAECVYFLTKRNEKNENLPNQDNR